MSGSWFDTVDNYCERLDPRFWAEPLNAWSNAAFLVAAFLALRLWLRTGRLDAVSLWLITVTAAIGVGSFLFHTIAVRWSVLADVLPIGIFIYSYFYLAMRRFLGLRPLAAAAATVLFCLFSLGFDRIWAVPFPGVTLNGSVGYVPAVLALLAVGCVCAFAGHTRVARALLLSGLVLTVSLCFRSVDLALCPVLPIGTHFLWHGLNGCVLFLLMRAAILHEGRPQDPPRPIRLQSAR